MFDLLPGGLSDRSRFCPRFPLGQRIIPAQVFKLLIPRLKDWPDLGHLIIGYVQSLPHPLQLVLHPAMGIAGLLFDWRVCRWFLPGEPMLAKRQHDRDSDGSDQQVSHSLTPGSLLRRTAQCLLPTVDYLASALARIAPS